MIPRYQTPEMQQLWSERATFERWLRVELAWLEACAQLGEIPPHIPALAREHAGIDEERMQVLEEENRHDLMAFVAHISETIPEEARPYIHNGLTSYDVIDTSLSLAIVGSLVVILKELEEVIQAVRERALEHKHTIQVGRTHGQHAEPTTFGLRLLNWHNILQRHERLLATHFPEWRVGKFSGSIGTYAHSRMRLEERACTLLGLKPAIPSTQIISRERHALYVMLLGSLASSLAKFADDIWHFAQTEIGEVKEGRAPGQVGSSSMPHKSSWDFANPIQCENIMSLARDMQSYVQIAVANQDVRHENELRHSANERMLFADASTCIHFMLRRFKKVMRELVVFPGTMERNLQSTGGAIFSQRLMTKLTEKGMGRQEAHALVSECVRRANSSKIEFRGLATRPGSEFEQLLSSEELQECFDPRYYTRHVDEIFNRILGQ